MFGTMHVMAQMVVCHCDKCAALPPKERAWTCSQVGAALPCGMGWGAQRAGRVSARHGAEAARPAGGMHCLAGCLHAVCTNKRCSWLPLQWEAHTGATSSKKWKTSLRVGLALCRASGCMCEPSCCWAPSAWDWRQRLLCCHQTGRCCLNACTQVRPGGAPGVPLSGNGMMVRWAALAGWLGGEGLD